MKVEQIRIPELSFSDSPVPDNSDLGYSFPEVAENGVRNAIKITPEVKKAIGTGTPLFSAGAATVAAGAAIKQQQAQQQPQM